MWDGFVSSQTRCCRDKIDMNDGPLLFMWWLRRFPKVWFMRDDTTNYDCTEALQHFSQNGTNPSEKARRKETNPCKKEGFCLVGEGHCKEHRQITLSQCPWPITHLLRKLAITNTCHPLIHKQLLHPTTFTILRIPCWISFSTPPTPPTLDIWEA